jgi:hypothetical protein
MPNTTFSPSANGFHFTNRFVNNIVKLPIYGNITTGGRCGGMSYAALDCFSSGTPIPAVKESDLATTGWVPADGTPLADYIYRRQIDSFLVPSAIKFITWSFTPDGPTPLRRGVTRWTKDDEFPKVRAAIDAHKPVPLGLIVATDINGLAHNHQVVAYGYEFDPANEAITVYIYDNNHPDMEITLKSDRNTPHFRESTGEDWRGFFVQDYRSQTPPVAAVAVAAAPVSFAMPAAPGRAKSLTVMFEGVTVKLADPASVGEFALSLNVSGQTARWPKTGARLARDGKHFAIGKSIDVKVRGGDALTIAVCGVEPSPLELPAVDNDAPAAAIEKSFTAADKWGRGRHTDEIVGPGGTYTVEYTIAPKR